MKLSEMYPSRYLRGCDLSGPVVVTVQRIATESLYRPKEGETQAFILYVANGSKGIILSKALGEAIGAAIGSDDTDNWINRRVVIYPQPMRVGGRDVIALRARAVAQEQSG